MELPKAEDTQGPALLCGALRDGGSEWATLSSVPGAWTPVVRGCITPSSHRCHARGA